MATSRKEVSASDQLQGKSNYISWIRKFEREARANDVLNILNGQEEIITAEPDEEDCVVMNNFTVGNANSTPRELRSATTLATPGSTTTSTTDSARSVIKWQVAQKKYESNKAKVRLASDILMDWVSPGIAIELEDEDNPATAYAIIKKRFKVSDDRAREMILEKVANLKLAQCDSMIDFLNQHRQHKQDLKKAGHTYTDGQLVTNILVGLPDGYRNFKKNYEWARAAAPDNAPDLDFLFDRLHAEADDQKAFADKKAKDSKGAKDKSKTKGGRIDKAKSDLYCNNCEKPGHDEKTCWRLHEELMPQAIKDKIAARAADKKKTTKKDWKKKGQVTLASGDVDHFNQEVENAISDDDNCECLSSMPNHTHPVSNPADMIQNSTRGHGQQGTELECRKKVSEGGTTDRSVGDMSISQQALAAFLGRSQHRELLDTWLADSGANMHITNNKKWFIKFKPLNLSISTADGKGSMSIQGGGTVKLYLTNEDGKVTAMTLKRVAYAPSGRCNLLSLSILADAGLKGSWDKRKLTVENGGETQVGYARSVGGLYHLVLATEKVAGKEKPVKPTDSPRVVAAIDFDDPVMQWHQRLGHVSFPVLRQLLKQSEGIDITDKQVQAKLKVICPVCAATKAICQIPREPAKRRAKEPGGMMHADTWGPYAMRGFDDTKFFLFITDDKTRYTWGERFKEKHELPQVFRRLHKHIAQAHNIEIRNYRFDNEFRRGPIGAWLESKGIGMESSVPYAHYMNGTAERVIRDVREKTAPLVQTHTMSGQITKIISGRSFEMLRESSIPENLWPEAMQQAIWHKNRLPTRALKSKKTPYEALTGDKPSMRRERIWGSRAYVTVPPERRGSKLHAPRGWVGYFVGCESESVYRIWKPDEHLVVRIGVARIDDGEGLDDEQDGPSMNDREPINNDQLQNVLDEESVLDEDNSSDSSSQQDEFSFEENNDHHDQELNKLPGINEQAQGDSDVGDFAQNNDDDVGIIDDDFDDDNLEAENQDAEHQNLNATHSDSDEEESHSDSDDNVVTSKYFAQMVDHGHDQSGDNLNDHDHNADTEGSDWTQESDMEQGKEDVKKSKKRKSQQDYIDQHKYIDDNMCDQCVLRGRLCDGERPCKACHSSRYKCIEQRPSTKALIPKDMPKKPPLTEGPVLINNPRCRQCHQGGARCVRLVGSKKCNRCISIHARTCRDDVEDLKPFVSGNDPAKSDKEKGVPLDQKCARCYRQGKLCDGERPCSTCASSNTSKNLCVTQEHYENTKDDPVCSHCKAVAGGSGTDPKAKGKLICDKHKPCARCVQDGRQVCIYPRQDGLMNEYCTVKTGFKGMGIENLDEDEAECVYCQRRNKNCDGEKPCTYCVKQKGNKSTPKTCTYRKRNGIVERYEIEPWSVEYSEEKSRSIMTLDPDYKARKAGKPVRNPEFSKKKSGDTSRPAQGSGVSSTIEDANATSETRRLFDCTFPNGYDTIYNDGSDLHCAWLAVRDAYTIMYPDTPPPTVNELQTIFLADRFQDPAGRTNRNNIYIDQIWVVLRLWGEDRGLNIQLGYVLEGQGPVLLSNTDQSDVRTVWVYNDNAQGIAKNKRRKARLNHFSGMKPKTSEPKAPPPEKNKRRRQNTPEDSPSPSDDDQVITRRGKIDEDLLAGKISEAMKSKLAKFTHAMVAFATPDMTDVPEPRNHAEAMRAPDSKHWQGAIASEVKSLIVNKTWEVVRLPQGRRALTSKWVFKRKLGPTGTISRYKARMVARGFQQVQGIDYEETFAAVVKPSSYKILLALAASLGWKIRKMDVKTAFLNGELEEEVYMKPPPGVKTPKGHVFRLRKALYGLKQAGRTWYDKFRATIEAWGWKASPYDGCVFIHKELRLIIALWVDDLLILGKESEAIRKFMKQVSKAFDMTDEGDCTYYLGMHIRQAEDGVYIHQETYAKQILRRFHLQNITPAKTPTDPNVKLRKEVEKTATPEFKEKYQEMVGSLMWLSTVTRPDLAYGAGLVARYNANPNQSHLDAVIRLYAYLNGTLDTGLYFPKNKEGLRLHGFTDSDHGGCEDTKRSTTGWLFTLGGSPISWCSQRQKTVSIATCDAEYIAASESVKEALWTKGFLNHLKIPECATDTVPIYIDNNAALKLTRNPEFHSRSKHINIRYHFIRERVQSKDIDTRRVATDDNLADVLTKGLARLKHEGFMQKLCMRPGGATR